MELENSPINFMTNFGHTDSINNENSIYNKENTIDKPSFSLINGSDVSNFFNKGIILNEQILPEKDEILVNDQLFRENFIEIINYAFEENMKIKFVLLYAEFLNDGRIRKVLHYILEDVNKYFTLTMINKSFFFICKMRKYLDKIMKYNPSSIMDFLSRYEISNYKFKIEEKKPITIQKPNSKNKVPIIKRIDNLKIGSNFVEFNIPYLQLPDSLKSMKLTFSIYIYNRKYKKFYLHNTIENYHVMLENLEQGSFIIMRIVITLDSNIGNMSPNFYFFTKSTIQYKLYVMGDNSENTFNYTEIDQNSKKTLYLNSPTMIDYSNICQFSFFKNNSFITLNTGDVMCNPWVLKEEEADRLSSINGKETKFYYELLEKSYKLNTNICIRKVVCGRDSMSALTFDGQLYINGSNLFGQLGLNYPYDTVIKELKQIKFDVDIQNNVFVLDVAAGELHYIALVKTQKLNLFRWGFKQGNETHPFDEESNIITRKDGSKIISIGNSKIPLLLPFENINSITKIYAKYHITIIQCLEKLNIENKIFYKRSVYSYGQVNTLQLGIPQITEFCEDYLAIPLKINSLSEYDVIDFCVGKYNTLFLINKNLNDNLDKLNTTGVVYGCGLNKNFELGTKNKEIRIPLQIIDNYKIKTLSCGNNFSLLSDVENYLYLLTTKFDKLQFEQFNTSTTENLYINTWFREKRLNIRSITSENKKVAFLVDNLINIV